MAADEVLELGGGGYSRHTGEHVNEVLRGATRQDPAYVSTFSGNQGTDGFIRRAAAEGRAQYLLGHTVTRAGPGGENKNKVVAARDLGPGVSAYRSGEGYVSGGPGTTTGPRNLGEYAHAKIASRGHLDRAFISSGSMTDGETKASGMVNFVREVRGQAAREAHQVNLVLMGKASASSVANNRFVRMVGPQGDHQVRQRLVKAIQSAKTDIVVTSPNLSDPQVVRALQEAGRRGVNVKVGYNRYDLGDGDVGRARATAEKLSRTRGVTTFEYQNGVAYDPTGKSKVMGYAHANFLGVDGGEFTAFGSVRFNQDFLNSKIADVILLGKDKAGYQFFLREIMKGVQQAKPKAGLELSYNVGEENRGLGLERFLPQTHSQNVGYAASIDPASLIDASNMYLSAIKRYHLGAVQGDAAAKILENRWQTLYTKFRNEPGAFSALYTMLHHEYKGVRPDATEVPWLLRNADEAMKTATVGQDSLMFGLVGGQVGRRGFLGSGLINFGRKLDHWAGTHDGSGAAGGFENLVTGGVDLMTSMVGNAVMFQFAALPLMRGAAAFRGNFEEGFRKASMVTGYAEGGVAKGSLFGRFVQALDGASSGFLLHAFDLFANPILNAFGAHGQKLAGDVRATIANNRKNSAEAMVRAYMTVDKAFEENTLLRPLSTKGVGLLYDKVLNLGHLVDYAKNIGANIQSLFGTNGWRQASDDASRELKLAQEALKSEGLQAFRARTAPLSQAFERTVTPTTFDDHAFRALARVESVMSSISPSGRVAVDQVRILEDRVYRLQSELNELKATDPAHTSVQDLEKKLAQQESLLGRAHSLVQRVLDKHPVFADERDYNRFQELQRNISAQKEKLAARGLTMDDDATVRDHVLSMEKERDGLQRFNIKRNYQARVDAARTVAAHDGVVARYREVGFVENIKRALDVRGDLIKGVRGRASSAAYLILGASVGFDIVSGDVASAPRLTLWEQIGASLSMSSTNRELTEGARQDLQVNYQAGFGRMGDVFFKATGSIVGLSHAAAAVGHTISLVSYAVQKVVAPVVRFAQFVAHARDTVRTETATSGQMAELMGAYLTGNVYAVSKRLREGGKLTAADQAILRAAGEKDPQALDKLAGDIYSRVLRDSQANNAQFSASQLTMYGLQGVLGSANLGALTVGAARFQDTTFFGFSIQGPVVMQVGLNVQLPIGLHHYRDEMGEEKSELTYVPGSNSELLFWTALQFKSYGAGIRFLGEQARKVIVATDPAGEYSHLLKMSDDLSNSMGVRTLKGSYTVIDKSVSFLASVPFRATEMAMGGFSRNLRSLASKAIIGSVYVAQLDPNPEGLKTLEGKVVSSLGAERQDGALSTLAVESKSPLNQAVASELATAYEDFGKSFEQKGLSLVIRRDGAESVVARKVLSWMGVHGQGVTMTMPDGTQRQAVAYSAESLARAIAKPFQALDVMPSFRAHAELNRELALHGGDLSKLDRHLQAYANRKMVKFVNSVAKNAPLVAAGASVAVAAAAVVMGSAAFTNAAEAYAEATQHNWMTRFLAAPLMFFGIGGHKSRFAMNSQEVVEHGKAIWGAGSFQEKGTVNDYRQVLYGSFVGKLQGLFKRSPVYAGTTSGYAGSGAFGFAIDPVKGSVIDPRTGNEFVLSGPFAQMTGLFSMTGNMVQTTFSGGARAATYSDRSAAEFGLALAMTSDIQSMLRAHKFAPRTQRATVGAMWHEASANNTLGLAGKMELRRREFMTSWILANNNSADVFNYFFRDRHRDRNLFAKLLADSTGTFAFGVDGTSLLAGRRIQQAIVQARTGAATGDLPETYIDYAPELTDSLMNRRRGLSVEELTQGNGNDTLFGTDARTFFGVALTAAPLLIGAGVAFSSIGLSTKLQGGTVTGHRSRRLQRQLDAHVPGDAPVYPEGLFDEVEPAQPRPKPKGPLGNLAKTLRMMVSASTSVAFKAVTTRAEGESFEDAVRREAVHDVVRKVFGNETGSGFAWAAVEPTSLGVNVESALDFDGDVSNHPGHTFWVLKRGRDVFTFAGVDAHTRSSMLASAKASGVNARFLIPSHSKDRNLISALDSLSFDSRSNVMDLGVGSLGAEVLGTVDAATGLRSPGTDGAGNIRLDEVNWAQLSEAGSHGTVVGRLIYRAGDVRTIREALTATTADATKALEDISAVKEGLERNRAELTGRLNQAADGNERARIQKRLDAVEARNQKLTEVQEAWRGRREYARSLTQEGGLFHHAGPMAALQRASLRLASVLSEAEAKARETLGADTRNLSEAIREEVIRSTTESGSAAAIVGDVNAELAKLREVQGGNVGPNAIGLDDLHFELDGRPANVFDLAQDLVTKQQLVANGLIHGSALSPDGKGLTEALGYARPKNLEQFAFELGGGRGLLYSKNFLTRAVDFVTFGGLTEVGKDLQKWREAQTAEISKGLAADVLKVSEKLGDGPSMALGVTARNVLTAIARGEVKTTDADFEDFVKQHLAVELGDGVASDEMAKTMSDLMQNEARQRVLGHNRAMSSFLYKSGIAATTSVRHAGRLALMGATSATAILAPIQDNSSYFILGMAARGIDNDAIDDAYANQMFKDAYAHSVESTGRNLVSVSGALIVGGTNALLEKAYVPLVNKAAARANLGFTLGFNTAGIDSDDIVGDRVSGAPGEARATRFGLTSGWKELGAGASTTVGKVFTGATRALAGVGGAVKATAAGMGIGAGIGSVVGLGAAALGADGTTSLYLATQAGVSSSAIIGAAQGIFAVTTTIKKVADVARAANIGWRTYVGLEGLAVAGAAIVGTGGAALAPLLPMALGLGAAMALGFAADWAFSKYVEPYLAENQDQVARGLQNFVSQDNWKGWMVRKALQAPSMIYTQAQRLYDGTWGQWARWGQTENASGFEKFVGSAARVVQGLGVFSFLSGKALEYHDPERTFGSSASLNADQWMLPFVRNQGIGKGSAFGASRMTPFFYGNRHDLIDMMYRNQQSMLAEDPEAITRQWISPDHAGSIPDPADSHITNAPRRTGSFFSRSFAGQSTLGEAAQEMLALRGQLSGFAIASLDGRLWGDKDHEAQIPLDKKHAWHNQTFGISTEIMRKTTWVAETFMELGRAFRRWTGSAVPGARGSGPQRAPQAIDGPLLGNWLRMDQLVSGREVISSRFGPRVHPITRRVQGHTGEDIAAASGQQVNAASRGTVTFSGWFGGYGNAVIIDHGNGVTTLYGHMSARYVKQGDVLELGARLGAVGSTGMSTGAHLHFEVRRNGQYLNPSQYLRGQVRGGHGGQGGGSHEDERNAQRVMDRSHHDHDGHGHGRGPAAQAQSLSTLGGRLQAVVSGANIGALRAEDIRRLNPNQFSHAIKRGAEDVERRYGVPALVTMAQAALESGWGRHAIGGYNIFGIKGRGSGGTTSVRTWEHVGGRDVVVNDNFAVYRNFSEAFDARGRLFHNGLYNEAIVDYRKTKDPYRFLSIIARVYATDPNYQAKVRTMMKQIEGMTGKPLSIDISAAPTPTGLNGADPNKPKAGPRQIQTGWDAERQKLLVQATYPDGTPYLNMIDPYMEPIELQLQDPYAGGLGG